ncbi:MAG: sugar phosphate nucleotidyltransferase [Oligoflexia bacterium]|nr:sugar phosphate nucleotidyltransferase [Oligoflexia bacterium]
MSSTWLFILAGGAGTRFWPRSRKNKPKQFLPIVGDKPLLLTTIERFRSMVPEERVVILTTEDLEAPTRDILGDQSKIQILSEPESRNTAPTIVAAMQWLKAKDKSATAIVVPADHWIGEEEEYRKVMQFAVTKVVKEKKLCTIGLQPTRPEVGYGYIRIGKSIEPSLYEVDRFVEKPSREVAETMVQSSEYLWNSGMFVWTVETFFKELDLCSPEFLPLSEYGKAVESSSANEKEVLRKTFAQVPAISIDYALMEKSKSVMVVPASTFLWNDLGSFLSLEEVYERAEGGVARAKKVIAIDSLANIVDVPGKTVALVGVTDMVLVDTGDVLLLAAKERAQDVKKLVERLKESKEIDIL